MVSKLDGGMWLTRMMLPEHVDALQKRDKEFNKRTKPVLDGQELQLIEHALFESFKARITISLQLFDEYEDKEVEGIVSTIQLHTKEIKLSTAKDEWQWISIKDIIGVR